MNSESKTLSERIKHLASRAGFDLCGIGTAGPMPRAAYFDSWLAAGNAGTMGYLHRHRRSRVDVSAWLPWARSVIVVGLNYGQPHPVKPTDEPRGRVAMYAWGKDYHGIMKSKLRALVDSLARERAQMQSAGAGESTVPPDQNPRDAAGEQWDEKSRGTWDHRGEFRYKICVDTSAITERELAAAAGVGWIGKNTLILNEDQGSNFFLGEIITDLDLTADPPVTDHCGSCTRCLDACPTQAFPKPYEMDASRCISYLTIEYRKEIDPALVAKMGDWLYGCDICQDVCPYNKRAPETREEGLRVAPEDAIDAAYPALGEIESWDEDAFRAAQAGKASERAMLRMWKRNASIVKANINQ